MINFRTTSVATALVVFLTSFTPSQAFRRNTGNFQIDVYVKII